MAKKENIAASPVFEEVAELTGLPCDQLVADMSKFLAEVGSSPETATLKDLRLAMAAFLAEIMGQECDLDEVDAETT